MTAGQTYAGLNPRAEASRETEERYVALRKRGVSAETAARNLGLTQTGAHTMEAYWRVQSGPASGLDSSCPSFADDDRHVAAVSGRGGYPSGGWRRADGQPWREAA